ncbi:MAG: hypothetical protein KDA37_15405 [Planctomycetales bacterium]|nr:hypothetical protein [Planctomycetales bacterium]MCA9564000.1 hypothetical protein [Myxococcales bacterium]
MSTNEPPERATSRREDHEIAVDMIVIQLGHAKGEDAAWSLSTALHSIDLRHAKRSSPALSGDEHDRVILALERAHQTARRDLLASYPRRNITIGITAVATMVHYWYDRSGWGDEVADARDLARCFRNDMHNICLIELVRERALRRRHVKPPADLFCADAA